MIRTAIHRLAHRLGWNVGSLVLIRRDGRLFRAFVCDTCGAVQHEREVTRVQAILLARTFGDRWDLGPGPIGSRRGDHHV